ncbi:hypothetical protein N0V82_002487 [Gnomoniopsis sp. IMI 355080]|nr:hypothetical protein N0V82_002487 [Gnomoniopsis sp. IMI 355080]
MFSNFAHKSPSQDHGSRVGAASSPVGTHQQRASAVLALPQITSDVKSEEPPLVAVTSDLPEYGGSPSPRPEQSHAPAKRPLHPTPQGAGSTTPGRARLEVVLNVSPQKALPGETLWTGVDLKDDGEEDGLVAAGNVSSRKRKATHTIAASSSIQSDNPATPAQVTGKRSRGRPKGWRPGMPSTKTGLPTASAFRYLDKDGNRIAPPPPPSSVAPKSTGQKRRGRPPRAPSPTPREIWERLDPPQYVPFLCEWKGCKAELQNMETLRRHVRKLHGLEKDRLVCRWGVCGWQEQGQQQVFTPEDFHEHMEERHLVPFVWHVGDGVRNEKLIYSELTSKEDEEVPTYLLGPDGEQVTPWVRGQEVEDFLTWRENRNRLKQILLQRDQNAPFEEEDEDEKEEGGTSPRA